jgi:hypothetical protein
MLLLSYKLILCLFIWSAWSKEYSLMIADAINSAGLDCAWVKGHMNFNLQTYKAGSPQSYIYHERLSQGSLSTTFIIPFGHPRCHNFLWLCIP